MLGRFVVPASRLEEFAKFATGLLPGNGEEGWSLSVLAGATRPTRWRRRWGTATVRRARAPQSSPWK